MLATVDELNFTLETWPDGLKDDIVDERIQQWEKENNTSYYDQIEYAIYRTLEVTSPIEDQADVLRLVLTLKQYIESLEMAYPNLMNILGEAISVYINERFFEFRSDDIVKAEGEDVWHTAWGGLYDEDLLDQIVGKREAEKEQERKQAKNKRAKSSFRVVAKWMSKTRTFRLLECLKVGR